jgi:hypothetical protein
MILTTPAQERYPRFSCPNPHCAQFNRPGTGNIVHRSWTGKARHIERLRCTLCHREFSEREGTLMARSKLQHEYPRTGRFRIHGLLEPQYGPNPTLKPSAANCRSNRTNERKVS